MEKETLAQEIANIGSGIRASLEVQREQIEEINKLLVELANLNSKIFDGSKNYD